MNPYLRLVRAGNAGVSFVGTLVGGLAAAGVGLGLSSEHAVALLLAAGSTTCVTAAGNVLNDLLDRETDRVNHPDRPLVVGSVSVGAARNLVVGLFVVAGLLVIPVVLIAPLLLPVLLLAVGALLAYELRAKSVGLLGNFLVAILTGAVFLYGGAAVGQLEVIVPLAAMATLATLSREIIKDMEDAEGDVDRRTLPRTRGMRVAGAAARLAVAAAILLTPVPLLLGRAGSGGVEAVYVGIVALADAIFVASVATLPRELHRAQTLSKGAMTVALLAFLATAFR